MSSILGISAFYHDSAAAIISDGELVAAAQEERFTRIKHDSSFPVNAVKYCLEEAALESETLEHIVFYDKPLPKFERLLETYLAFAPRGYRSFAMAIPVWLKEKLFQKQFLLDELSECIGNDNRDGLPLGDRLLFNEHHLSHAASAFYPSPFNDALILTMDGVGEWATTSVAIGSGANINIIKEMHFPHSLGLLYSAFTYYTGFKVNSGEYKVMGLAPYGNPRFKDLIINELMDLKEDGSFRLNMEYFDYCTGLRMTNDRFSRIFGEPVRAPEERLTQVHMDLAASIQAATEEIVLRIVRSSAKETGQKNLCLAGGVALNCVANGKIRRSKLFENMWIQPAAGDAGGAMGAALCAHYMHNGNERLTAKTTINIDSMKGSYLGPSFSEQEIQSSLDSVGANYKTLEESDLLTRVSNDLANHKAIGWFQGRMEFGPRALGARSILADPKSPKMQSLLNLKVKYRESFRPFAPAVLREDVSDWFEFEGDSPYMLLVDEVAKSKQKKMTDEEKALFGIEKLNVSRSEIPAVTHVDYSARIQTVHRETNPRFHALIINFKSLTGCSVLVNTSFNVRGEPIVCTPEDAFSCFMGTEIDVLAIGNCYLKKEDQNPSLLKNYEDKFELD